MTESGDAIELYEEEKDVNLIDVPDEEVRTKMSVKKGRKQRLPSNSLCFETITVKEEPETFKEQPRKPRITKKIMKILESDDDTIVPVILKKDIKTEVLTKKRGRPKREKTMENISKEQSPSDSSSFTFVEVQSILKNKNNSDPEWVESDSDYELPSPKPKRKNAKAPTKKNVKVIDLTCF